MKKSSILLLAFLLVLTACGDQRSEREENMNTEKIQYPMPQGGKVEYEGHGNEDWFAYGAMTGVGDANANGVTQAHQFDDGRYLHTISLNIEPAPDGYFYEGWLVKGPSVISTGHLTNPFADVRHNLRFESDTDYTGYLTVVVTLEPDDGNPAPADHVAEGKLKVTKR
ncbi:MAG: anti-sigma factor [Candidatus Peregrinibacteria bacterium]|nr:anti-sigma factor [Candidatus Peregrinibacteria bacterium]MCB9808555.1 anti-sigma factor [Candidatus Peribacteria bacterium]